MAELQNLKKHEMFLSLKKDLALVDALKKKKNYCLSLHYYKQHFIYPDSNSLSPFAKF